VISRKAPGIGSALGVAFAALGLFALRAGTRSAEEGPDTDLIAASHEIFVGTCVETVSRYDPAWGTVVTDARFRVEGALKGSPGRSVTLTVPGGEIPERNLGVLVPEAPRFTLGERALVFVWIDRGGVRQVCGLGRGVRPPSEADDLERRLR
jgi:hypothetical protein